MKKLKANRLSIITALLFTGSTLLYGGSEGDTESNVYYGDLAGVNLDGTGTFNVFVGKFAGSNTTSGANNTFSGYASGYENTTGLYNTFNGAFSGYHSTTGSFNMFNGF